jgi:hypothetical protein
MKPFPVRAIAYVLLGVGLFSTTGGEAFAQIAQMKGQPTPVTTGDIDGIHKQIVLRSIEGDGVPGIEVHLTPASPDLGGPLDGSLPQVATTDAQGHVTFSGLGEWIWMVSFSGTFRGRVLQPISEQGQAPWGRTRAGGGFPVMVQRQEEDAAATPMVINATPQPEVQPSLFVLVPAQEYWAPSLDLALPAEQPQPLAMTLDERSSAPPLVQASASLPDQEGHIDNLIRWFYLLPLAVALFALQRAWQQGRVALSNRSPAGIGSDTRDTDERVGDL